MQMNVVALLAFGASKRFHKSCLSKLSDVVQRIAKGAFILRRHVDSLDLTTP